VRNKDVLPAVKDGNILYTIKKRKDSWTGHILHSKHPLKHVVERKIEEKIKEKQDEYRDVINYFMTLRKRADTGN
jgi:hypothetical protein